MAVYKRGNINKNNFNTFKYDFLLDYFRSIYLSNYFSYTEDEMPISIEMLNLIKETCWSGSTMINDVVSRFDNWSEDDILYASDMIKNISDSNLVNMKDKKIIISNYFNVCIALNLIFLDCTLMNAILIIMRIFGNVNLTTKQYLINVIY